MAFFKKKKFKIYKIYILSISTFILFYLSIRKFSFFKLNDNNYKKKINSKRINQVSDDGGDSKFISDVNKICKKASSDLQKYFRTYDSSLVDISSMSFEQIEYYPEYIEALIDIIEQDGNIKDNFLIYLQHAAASFMFFILGIISVIAWFFFGFFCCCNCCCCCCCKKEECKFRFLFFPLIFDLAIIITCLAGIFSASKMFTGLADVECSLMKFISEINSGENRQNEVEWIGFDGISTTFENIKNKVNAIKDEKEVELNDIYTELTVLKENFPNILKDSYTQMLDPYDPDSPLIFDTQYLVHLGQENTLNSLDVGVIDVLYNYGPLRTDEKFLYKLNEQYEQMTNLADIYLDKAYNCFNNILNGNTVEQIIEESKEKIEEIHKSMNNIKAQIAKYIVDYSDPIENYGKYVVKIIYIVIMSLAAFSGFSVVMMFITAEDYCYGKCCCGKGFTKTLAHISWNIMSLVMICSFLICGMLFLLSYLGKDLFEVITIIFGEKNLYNRKPILIKGDVADYFNICFHGDGDLAYLLAITNETSPTYYFDVLNSIKDDIFEAKENVEKDDVVIEAFKEEISKRKEYTNVNIFDFNTTTITNLDKLIYKFNDLVKDYVYDVWTLNETCPDENYVLIHCSDDTPVTPKDLNTEPIPKECLNFNEWKINYKERYRSYVLLLDEIYTTPTKAGNFFVNIVNNITDYIDNGNAIYTLEIQLDIVEEAYDEVIAKELEVLEEYDETLRDLLSVFDGLNNGGESLFSFLNCKFMRDNGLIILKNLEDSFSQNVQSIAITMVFASFGMLFSIIFTILEIIILKVSFYLQRRRKEKEEQITLAMGIKTRATTYGEGINSEKGFKKKKKPKMKNREKEDYDDDD